MFRVDPQKFKNVDREVNALEFLTTAHPRLQCWKLRATDSAIRSVTAEMIITGWNPIEVGMTDPSATVYVAYKLPVVPC
jgi:hypothetical protein